MKRPDYYCYPAILTFEDEKEIAVTFPDLPGCTTSGENDVDALTSAAEALGGHLWVMEDFGEEIPTPTPLKDIHCAKNEQVTLVRVYMPSVRLAEVTRAVNRTVTLPAWLNAAALEHNLNFSQLLQEAIKKKLHVS